MGANMGLFPRPCSGSGIRISVTFRWRRGALESLEKVLESRKEDLVLKG